MAYRRNGKPRIEALRSVLCSYARLNTRFETRRRQHTVYPAYRLTVRIVGKMRGKVLEHYLWACYAVRPASVYHSTIGRLLDKPAPDGTRRKSNIPRPTLEVVWTGTSMWKLFDVLDNDLGTAKLNHQVRMLLRARAYSQASKNLSGMRRVS